MGDILVRVFTHINKNVVKRVACIISFNFTDVYDWSNIPDQIFLILFSLHRK